MKTQQQDPKEQPARDAFKLTNTVPGQDAIDSDNDITEEELALLDAAGEDDEERKLEEAALDKYEFMREAYLQRRRNLVHDGNPPKKTEDEDTK